MKGAGSLRLTGSGPPSGRSGRPRCAQPKGPRGRIEEATGALAQRFRYDSYGLPAETSGIPIRFTGHYYDAELNLYYARARVYSPALGRFLQTDPIGYEDDLNWYAYVKNDPVNFFDPTGLQRLPVRRRPVGMGHNGGPSLAREQSLVQAIQRLDPQYRPPANMGAMNLSQFREHRRQLEGDLALRRSLDLDGTSPNAGSLAQARLGIILADSSETPTTTNRGERTFQFQNGKMKGAEAFEFLVGSNFTKRANGTLTSGPIDLGNGVEANFNLHRGTSEGRTGLVLEGQLKFSVSGSRIVRRQKVKIEFDE